MENRIIKLWFARVFLVISESTAVKWELYYYKNIYGDEINRLGCRSVWRDKKGNFYRVKELKYHE